MSKRHVAQTSKEPNSSVRREKSSDVKDPCSSGFERAMKLSSVSAA